MLQHSRHAAQPAEQTEGRHRSAYRAALSNHWTPLTVILVVLAVAAAAGILLVIRGRSTDAAAGSAPSSIAQGVDPTAWVSPPSGAADFVSPADRLPEETPHAAPLAAQPATSAAPTCGLPGGAFQLTATPEIAAAVQQVWTTVVQPQTPCQLAVAAAPSGQVAGQLGTLTADAWLPDSSVWAAAVGQPAAAPVSVAISPVVLALSPGAVQAVGAANLSFSAVLASRLTAAPIRVGLPDPGQSTAAAGALLALRAGLAGAKDVNAALTWAMRTSPAGLPADTGAALGQLAAQPGVAMPATEQAVAALNSGGQAAQAVYPDASVGYSLNYPFVTLNSSAEAFGLAAALITALRSDGGREVLRAAGFRAPDGGPTAFAAAGVDGSRAVNPRTPTAADVQAIGAAVAISNESSRLLAVMDVSGSMAGVVPGAGGATRIDLARAAAIRGLGLYPATSAIGLWDFSRKIDGDNDYRELVPVGLLAAVTNGTTGQQQISSALQAIQVVPDGGTGLYDTTLAAVRTMRQSWDPTRVNTVLLLTDGQNDDQGSITLDQLLATLQAEQDSSRPVQVIAIGFGPDTDTAALQAITAATGGATYVAADPRDIGEIFLDAVGRRLCAPNC